MKKYDLPYPKFENDNLNYYVTISDYEGKEFNIKENNLYNALSEVINYSLYFSFYIGKKHCHEHEFDYVIKNLYLYPESFNLNDVDKKCYSNDELRYLNHLQKFLLFIGRKDSNKITDNLCNNERARLFKNTRKLYFSDEKCKELFNGKKIYLNLYSNKENLDIILLNKEGDIIGLLNATFIESKKINNLKDNDINFDFYGYDNFKSFKESLQNSFLGETINIYKVILKEKY